MVLRTGTEQEVALEELNLKMNGPITADNVPMICHWLRDQMNQADIIKVCLKDIEKIDLAGFNALVHMHMNASRLNKELSYINCVDQRLVHLVDLTHFHDVFITQ